MRTDADQERRNARYPACGGADRQTAGPRSIACDDAPSGRWKSEPRRFERCFVQPINSLAERGRLHGASELDARTRYRSMENKFVYYRAKREERRCRKDHRKHNRLRWQDKASLRLYTDFLGKMLSAHCFRLRKRSSFRPVRCVSDGGIADNTLVVLANPPCHRNVRSAVSTPQPVFARLSAMNV